MHRYFFASVTLPAKSEAKQWLILQVSCESLYIPAAIVHSIVTCIEAGLHMQLGDSAWK